MDSPELPPQPPPLPEPEPRPPYGFWSTLGLGLVAVLVMVFSQAVVGFAWGVVAGARLAMRRGTNFSASELTARLVENPLFLSLCVLIAIPPVLGALWLFTFLRGRRFLEDLGLRRFRLRQLLFWLVAMAATLGACEWVLRSLGEVNIDQPFARPLAYPACIPLILFATVVGAPLIEELLFRGFMFTGMARSRWTTLLAILVPNAVWVSMHVQYRWPTLASLFVMGGVFGLARRFSRSTWVPVILHAAMNAVAMVMLLSLLYPRGSHGGFDFGGGTARRYSILASEAATAGRTEEAVKYYSKALEIDPNSPDALRARARAYFDLEDWDRAIADFGRLAALDPPDANAFYWRGSAHVQQDDFEDADADFTRALEIDPDFGKAYWMRGYARYCLGRYKAAIADETEAIRRIPDLSSAYNDRGMSLEELGNLDEAIADYTRAIRLDPYFEDALNNRGLAHRKNGDFDLALRDFNAAIRLAPRRGLYHVNRAETLEQRGDFAEAASAYRHAVQANPRYAYALDSLAWLLSTCPEERVRDGRQAVENAREAIRLTDWKRTRYFETMAAACAETGDYEEAVWWQRQRLKDSRLTSSQWEAAEGRLHTYELRQPWRESAASAK